MQKTICIFSALYDPHIGGVENFTKELSKALIQRGFQIIIVTNNHASLPSFENPEPGLRIYRLPCRSLLGDRLPLPKRNAEFRKLMDELKRTPIDALCINTRFYPHSLVGANVARKKGIRPIVIEHGSDYLTLGNPLFDAVIKRYEHHMTDKLKRFDPDFYAVSQQGSHWLKTFDIASKGQISNAINTSEFLSRNSQRDFRTEFKIPQDTPIVAFVGRLTPEKGIKELVEAAELLSTRTSTQFLIAGNGTLRASLEESASPNVHFLGALPQQDIVALLEAADALCLPSRSEGFATVLLEAAACKTVPVITHVGGVDELIPDSDHGIVLSSKEPSVIAEALLALGNDPEGMHVMANTIYERVKNGYNWQKTADTLIRAIEAARQ